MTKSEVLKQIGEGRIPHYVHWTTGFTGEGYSKGYQVSRNVAFEWTDSKNAGVYLYERDENQSVTDWCLAELKWAPDDGLTVG